MLFGTDGIRGKYGDYPLDSSTIRKIGSAISKSLDDSGIEKIILAHDGRQSCDDIYKNLIAGICSTKQYEVVYLGLFPTPALTYILSQNKSLDAIGIEITASHNPYYDNGIKIFDRLGFKIKSHQESKIEKILSEECEVTKDIELKTSPDDSIRKKYTSFISKMLLSKQKPSYKLHIAIDCANGAMSNVISDIGWPDNISISKFHNSPNGKNINNKCGAVHPEHLSKVIRESDRMSHSNIINFGVCFDGDGDRAIIVDSSGNILDGDDLLYLFAIHSKDNNKAVGTVMTNYGIRGNLEKKGINFIETDVGDKNVLASIMKNQAYIGAESSGHIIHTNIADIPIGDGLVTLIKFIHLLFDTNKNIEEIYPASLKIPSKLINIESNAPDNFLKKNQLIFTKVREKLENGGRIFIRKSGTQSLIRVLLEHKSPQVLDEANTMIRNIE